MQVQTVCIEDHTVLVIKDTPQQQPIATADSVFLRRAFGSNDKPAQSRHGQLNLR